MCVNDSDLSANTRARKIFHEANGADIYYFKLLIKQTLKSISTEFE